MKPWSIKFWVVSTVWFIVLSCGATLLILGNGLVSDGLEPCRALDSYFKRSNCLKILHYTYYNHSIYNLSFSPNGQLIAGGGIGGSPTIWAVDSGMILHQFRHGIGSTDHLVFSPDGQMIAFSQSYITHTALTLADPVSGTITTYLDNYSPINDITYSPNGTMLAVASATDDNKSIDFISTLDGRLANTFKIGQDTVVEELEFSPDGERLLAVVRGDGNKKIYTWQAKDGTQIGAITLPVSQSLGVAFSPTKELVALGNCVRRDSVRGGSCGQAEITVWQISDGQLIHRLKVPGYYVRTLVFSGDGHLLASTTEGEGRGYVQIWQVSDGTLRQTLEEPKGFFISSHFHLIYFTR